MTIPVYTIKDFDWRVVNDSPVWLKPRRTIWYISRDLNNKREDFRDKRGRLRTWRTMEKAKEYFRKHSEKFKNNEFPS